MPRSTAWTLGTLGLLALAFALTWADGARLRRRSAPSQAAAAAFAARHRLSALALFAGAPHTRQPGLALPPDAIQDHPVPLDRFPIPCPPHGSLD
ncbi:MAG TPA: hypothetical protein VK188_15880 [Holophaga sp.]|nr:hypothetical protein [Holophaga sp.]